MHSDFSFDMMLCGGMGAFVYDIYLLNYDFLPWIADQTAQLEHVKPIGFAKSVFCEKNGTPRQSGLVAGARATIEVRRDVFTNPEHSLEKIDQFSHLWYVQLAFAARVARVNS